MLMDSVECTRFIWVNILSQVWASGSLIIFLNIKVVVGSCKFCVNVYNNYVHVMFLKDDLGNHGYLSHIVQTDGSCKHLL